MTERTFEYVEAEVVAAMEAMRPHLHPDITDEDATRVFEAKHPDLAQKLHRAVVRRDIEQIWIEDTRVALGLDRDEDDEGRITIEVDGKSIKLPRYIVNPGETEDFIDSKHLLPPHAKVRHHRLHAEWMIRVGSVDAGREQLNVNAELLRRAGGNQSAMIGDLLS